jgi:hypothetical protein
MASAVSFAANVSEILAFPLTLLALRLAARADRRQRYRPRHARRPTARQANYELAELDQARRGRPDTAMRKDRGESGPGQEMRRDPHQAGRCRRDPAGGPSWTGLREGAAGMTAGESLEASQADMADWYGAETP